MAKQSLLQKFGKLSEAKKLLVFLLVFVIIGGGYMAYSSFAYTNNTYVKFERPCYSFDALQWKKNNAYVSTWNPCNDQWLTYIIDSPKDVGEFKKGHDGIKIFSSAETQGARGACPLTGCSSMQERIDLFKKSMSSKETILSESDRTVGGRPAHVINYKYATTWLLDPASGLQGQSVGYNTLVIVDTKKDLIPANVELRKCFVQTEYEKTYNCKLAKRFVDIYVEHIRYFEGFKDHTNEPLHPDSRFNINKSLDTWKWAQ